MSKQHSTRSREVEIWAYCVLVYLLVWLAVFSATLLVEVVPILRYVLGAALVVWLVFTGLSLILIHRREKREA